MFEFRFAGFKIRKFRKEIEPQEVLLDALSQKKEKEIGVSEKKLETPLSKNILRGFWVFFLFLILILFGRTFQLQVLEGETFAKLSEENKFVIRLIQSERGVIYDNNLEQLVFNRPSFDFVCEGEAVQENLDHQTLILLKTRIDEYPNCEIRKNMVREYVGEGFFSHLVGYQRQTGEKTGLEEYYDQILRARPGELQIKKDVYGNPIAKEIISMPESGKSLVLWLDSELQRKITRVLEETIKNIGAVGGAAVALNPQTGGVLALVSYPYFDNNLFSKPISKKQWQELQGDSRDPLFNRAISGKYLTGSTIKPLLASAVLEEEIISPEKGLYCSGFIIIPNPWDPTASSTKKDWRAHGWTNMKKAIAESCNVYFYTVGGGYKEQKGLGPTKIKEYLELFGWSAQTKIDLPGESEGFIPDKEWKKETWGRDWWDGDTYNLSIGQGFLQITPLEVAVSFAAIANGGKILQPTCLKEIVDTSAGSVQVVEPQIIRENFIQPENLQIVREGMRQAVTGVGSPHASAVSLNSLPVAVAVKTGTAELGEEHYHNWATVFAPYDNPRLVLTLVIENVEGYRVAALPVVKEVLEWYFTPK